MLGGDAGFGAERGLDMSGDGRFVVFTSRATNLDPADTDNNTDVYLHDRGTATIPPSTRLVSVTNPALPGTKGQADFPSVSDDGRFVAFTSDSSNLVPNDTNQARDVFVRDMQQNTTIRVSTSSTGAQGVGIVGLPVPPGSNDLERGDSLNPDISADGRYVAFESNAINLVPLDMNFTTDIFVKDLQTNTTTRASVTSTGAQGFGYSFRPSISDDGQAVAFESTSPELFSQAGPGVRNPGTGILDIYVFQDGGTEQVSVTSDEFTLAACPQVQVPTFSGNTQASISGDGNHVAWTSACTDVVPNDSNGRLDVFIRDRQAGVTSAVSVETDGNTVDTPTIDGPFGNGDSFAPSVSDDGRFVAFYTTASDLSVIGDTPFPTVPLSDGRGEGYVRDRVAQVTTPVTSSYTNFPKVNGDGTVIAYTSSATDLVPGDTNGLVDVFVSLVTPDPAGLWVLPEPEARRLMSELADAIPGLETSMIDDNAGTFTNPGCVTREFPVPSLARPLPLGDVDYLTALSVQPYPTLQGGTGEPLRGPCRPDAMTLLTIRP
jgi:Tol biopolymer transport system component